MCLWQSAQYIHTYTQYERRRRHPAGFYHQPGRWGRGAVGTGAARNPPAPRPSPPPPPPPPPSIQPAAAAAASDPTPGDGETLTWELDRRRRRRRYDGTAGWAVWGQRPAPRCQCGNHRGSDFQRPVDLKRRSAATHAGQRDAREDPGKSEDWRTGGLEIRACRLQLEIEFAIGDTWDDIKPAQSAIRN